MAAIVRAAQVGRWQARFGACVAAVISNKGEAGGITIAHAQGIATAVVEHKAFGAREDFDAALAAAIDAHVPALVLLAGLRGCA